METGIMHFSDPPDVFQSQPLNNVEIELANAKNYIQELEKKIKLLEIDIAEKNSKISDIEDNMELLEVEDWRVECDYGVGYFEGQIYWTFAYGGIRYEDRRPSLEAVWDLTGKIKEAEYYDSNNKLIEKWEDGKRVEISDTEDSDEEDSNEEDSNKKDRVRSFLESMYITHKDSDVRIYPKINF
jgi:hypothetical protein